MEHNCNKLIKIFVIIEGIALFSIAALFLAYDNEEVPSAYAVKENLTTENLEFKIITKAVCEESSEHIFCHDELFIRCNGSEYHINKDNFENFTDCNNKKLSLQDIKVTGQAIFKKEWSDPRSWNLTAASNP